MTLLAQGFQIGRVISAMLGQLKDVVTVAVLIGDRIKAVLTDALITVVDVLLELDPIVNPWTPIPGETHIRNIGYCESCHTLPLQPVPRRATSRLCLPHPHRKEYPYLALPYHKSPDRTVQNQSAPCHAAPDST